MVSEYLERRIRDRLVIARDLAMTPGRTLDAISAICDGLDVMFAATTVDAETGRPAFSTVSSYASELTGFWACELAGQDPKCLQSRETNLDEARRFMTGLTDHGEAETKIVNKRKDGDLYGCHILACKPPQADDGNPTFYAFLARCPIADCP